MEIMIIMSFLVKTDCIVLFSKWIHTTCNHYFLFDNLIVAMRVTKQEMHIIENCKLP